MLSRRRILDWALAALLLVVPALVLRASLKRPDDTNVVDKAVLRVSSPLQAAVSWMVDRVGNVWSRYVSLIGVESENRELRDENEKLRTELAAATRHDMDITTLEKMLQLRDETHAVTVAARVVAASMSPHYRVMRVRIDHGEPEIHDDDAVITSEGLVGRILKVTGNQADVMLATDADSKVPVRIKRSGLIGEVRGQGAADSYLCKFAWQTGTEPEGQTEAPIQEGDIVETAGGSKFPAGITVGVISKVVDKVDLDQEAWVEPAVKFGELRGVTVITAPPPPPDPDADDKRKSDSAFDVRPD